MKIEEILQLKEAGFTSEEIANLGNLVDKEVAEVPEAPEQIDYTEHFNTLKSEIISEMRNIFLSEGTKGSQPVEETVDDILKNHFGGK